MAYDKDDDAARKKRRQAAFRGAERRLSGGSARTITEQLADLAALPALLGRDPEEEPDIYGDGVVAELERRVAELLGTEDAAYFPSGTMAQQAALRSWAGRTGNPVVALHPRSHPEAHEDGALGVVSGLRTVYPTTEVRQPTAAEVREHPEPFGTLMLELPLRDPGFILPTWEELEELVAAGRERDAVIHFDGARLWETTVHFGKTLPEIAALADSVYVSFYKSLGGLSGAALAGSRSLVEEARVWRHRYGGQMFRQYPQALSALAGLERELPRLPSYVEHAKVVARALREGFEASRLPWFRIQPQEPTTHQFHVWAAYDADALTEASVRLAEETGTQLFGRWWAEGPPGLALAELTVTQEALSWTAQDVRTAVDAFVTRIEGLDAPASDGGPGPGGPGPASM
ncbi:beta-eliminating lyase-related protein [Streptomyces sp. G-G2]|uniref:threonine aldolase family protein n=1 Tax=Streptomyces sp. G-G2 TaxID=3046201 RepID=UPI0024BB47A2|nr:beta-eliminating lyase-related protein [Streptomyces sp. G-G2]MDJ0384931.1 beta-eliminating lyase-related protein [Streptomyces sp. G-G2]